MSSPGERPEKKSPHYFKGSILNIGVKIKKVRHNASNSCKLELPHNNTQEGECIMPQSDYISKLLDIGSINILDLNINDKSIVVALRLQRRPLICPDC